MKEMEISEKKSTDTHYQVGKNVRKTIEDIGGTMTEELPTPKKSLREFEKANQLIE